MFIIALIVARLRCSNMDHLGSDDDELVAGSRLPTGQMVGFYGQYSSTTPTQSEPEQECAAKNNVWLIGLDTDKQR